MRRLFKLLMPSLGVAEAQQYGYDASETAEAFKCDQLTVISETQDGYYDICLGMEQQILAPCENGAGGNAGIMDGQYCANACKKRCAEDVKCGEWMVTTGGCQIDKGSSTPGDTGIKALGMECSMHQQARVFSGQKIMHGGIEVIEQDSLVSCPPGTMTAVAHIRNGGPTVTEEEKITHCREACWTKPACSAWMYNSVIGCQYGTSAELCTRTPTLGQGSPSQVFKRTCEDEAGTDMVEIGFAVGGAVVLIMIAVIVYNAWQPRQRTTKARGIPGLSQDSLESSFHPVPTMHDPMPAQPQAYNPVPVQQPMYMQGTMAYSQHMAHPQTQPMMHTQLPTQHGPMAHVQYTSLHHG